MDLHPLQEAFFLQLKEENFKYVSARVVFASHDHFRLRVAKGIELEAKLRGHFYLSDEDYPVVGDWVVIEEAGVDHQFWPIEAVLPRFSSLKRAERSGIEVMAANVNVIAIVTSFNLDLNGRRLERALAMIEESRARPLIVVNKVDLVLPDERDEILTSLRERFQDIEIIACSAEKKVGIESVLASVRTGETIAFLGMSGVGKSTLVNSILDEHVLKTQAVREEDARGRHTTTHRELFLADAGFWVLDSPGIRSFSFAGDEEQLDSSFKDISALFTECRFKDCHHHAEPGCAVLAALQEGVLDEDRWKNYLKMKRELTFHENKTDKKYLSEQKKMWAKRTASQRKVKF